MHLAPRRAGWLAGTSPPGRDGYRRGCGGVFGVGRDARQVGELDGEPALDVVVPHYLGGGPEQFRALLLGHGECLVQGVGLLRDVERVQRDSEVSEFSVRPGGF